MTRLCGNCFWFSILPSCQELQKAGSRACGQWSPDAAKILEQLREENQDKQTIKLLINYITEKCNRCPAYHPGKKCMIEDCDSYLLEYFAGMTATREVKPRKAG